MQWDQTSSEEIPGGQDAPLEQCLEALQTERLRAEAWHLRTQEAYSERATVLSMLALLAREKEMKGEGWCVGCKRLSEYEKNLLRARNRSSGVNPDCTTLLVIDLPDPFGQISFHIHDRDVGWFSWVPDYEAGPVDVHLSRENTSRMAALLGIPLPIHRDEENDDQGGAPQRPDTF